MIIFIMLIVLCFLKNLFFKKEVNYIHVKSISLMYPDTLQSGAQFWIKQAISSI